MTHSKAYVQHLFAGPFPGQIDPWAEDAHYFQQIHAGMIDQLLQQIRTPLAEMGYRVGREASLQIADNREPDIFVHRAMNAPHPAVLLDYELAATEVLAYPGYALDDDNLRLQSVHITHDQSNQLVTIIEIVSPGNKDRSEAIADYRRRREKLLLDQGINIVEVDATRSVKHLVSHPAANNHAYHTAVYIPDQYPRLIDMDFGKPMQRIAIPLRGEVIAVELQSAYDYAYQNAMIASQLHGDQFYSEEKMPFPSLLTDAQRRDCLKRVAQWQTTLRQLGQSGNGE